MTARSKESSKATQNDFLPSPTVSSGQQDFALKTVNEISKVAGKAKWFKQAKTSGFERMAKICAIQAYFCLEEVMDTAAAEREALYKSLTNERPHWVRIFRKILDPKAPLVETEAKAASF